MRVVVTDLLHAVSTGPWALLAMSLLVLLDAFLVVIPGEVAVTTVAAIATSTGAPPLWLVICCAAIAATAGDLSCYGIGRAVGVQRWRWMRARRVSSAIAWASSRLDRGLATTLFTARFIPFARLAVNLSAGATRVGFARFATLVAAAAMAWSLYQSLIGAAVAQLFPDNLFLAILVSVVTALAVGALLDLAVALLRRRRRQRAGETTTTQSEASPPSR